MFQRNFSVIFCAFILVSCEFFQKKELSSDIVVDTVVNYNTVDVYPLFPDCDSIPSQDKQRICSQIHLCEHIYASLSSSQIFTRKKVNDTIYVKLKIDNKGKVLLTNYKTSDLLKNQIPHLDSLISSGVSSLPQMKPAIKRGIPVSTEFTLPIIVLN